MDDRQQQIKENEGLQESRVNEEFVDFLKKWSQPVLLVIVLISGSWFVYQRYQQFREGRVNNAFAEYEAVAGSPDPLPASLRAVAEEYTDVGSITPLAYLRLGDVHLAAVRRGLEPAAPLDALGNPENESDILDEDGRQDHLDRAASAYRDVIDATAGDSAKAVLAVSAYFGLAAVAEARGDVDDARSQYTRAAEAAREANLTGLPEIAEERANSLDALPPAGDLFSARELPVLPGFPAPPEPEPEPELTLDDPATDPASDAADPVDTDADAADAPTTDDPAPND